MSGTSDTVQQLRKRLETFAERVRKFKPGASSNVFERSRDETTHLCVSTLSSPTADTIDFCLEVLAASGGLEVAGDLVSGRTGDVLAELDSVMVSPHGDAVPIEVLAFIEAQESRVIEYLRTHV